MSFILDALKRNASDTETGNVPTLHTQAPVATRRLTTDRSGPLLFFSSLVLLVSAVSFLQPWKRNVVDRVTPEIIRAEAVVQDIRILGKVDYSRYPLRQRIVRMDVQPIVAPATSQSATGEVLPEKPGRRVELTQPQSSIDNVSPALKELFDQVVQESKPETGMQSETGGVQPSQNPAPTVEVSPLTRKPLSYQSHVPSMRFQAHLYSSDANKRWIKVNGVEHVEGDWITDKIRLIAIEPGKVIMEMEGEKFSLPALTSW